MTTMHKQGKELVAVIHSNGIYRNFEGKIYRHSFDEYPSKKHQHTGFPSLFSILDRHPSAEPVYAGEVVMVQF